MAASSVQVGDTTWIYCFMGIDSTKACGSGIRKEAYKYNTVSDTWYQISDVPDTGGRIAASATTVNGKIYLIGGYKVFTSCNEFTSPRVDILDPLTDTWSMGDSTPTPIDDHVQVAYRDSLIITVSGWSNNTNTRSVQVYDTYLDSWSYANLIPGPGLFGHAGAISGDTILYMDGVRISGFNFVLTNAVWQGVINPQNPNSIAWTPLGNHPGPLLYRGGGFAYGGRIVFTGGTNNAYNIDGIGYNNVPSVESGRTWGYHLASGTYEEYARNPDSVMDVREVVQVNDNQFYVIGGMSSGQAVTNQVSVFVVDTVLVGRAAPLLPFEVRLQQGPGQDNPSLELSLDHPAQVHISIVDLSGRRLMALETDFAAGSTSFPLGTLTRQLARGIYLVQVALEGQERSLKLWVD